MTRKNDFEPIVTSDGNFKIEHLKDLYLVLDVLFDNGDKRSITVNMRPTNHLFSRAVTSEDLKCKASLVAKGYWLRNYIHYEGNYQEIKGSPPVLKENRIFCNEKWVDSFLFPEFVRLLGERPSRTTVLANSGDSKTCLSGILELEHRPDDVYLVFFTLTKVNSRQVNMLIASAYCVSKSGHDKARRLLSPRAEEAKPFILVLRNVLEGRLPLESQKKSKRVHRRKKKSQRL